jgi:hypothetical protein
MGFALGGELCWLGRMLLIFPFALHSWQKILCQSVTVHKWTSKNQQNSQNIHPTDPPHYPPPPPPPTYLWLNKNHKGGGGAWGSNTRREKMMTKIHGFSINNRDQLSAVCISSGTSLAYWQTVKIQYRSSSSTGAASTHVCRIIN